MDIGDIKDRLSRKSGVTGCDENVRERNVLFWKTSVSATRRVHLSETRLDSIRFHHSQIDPTTTVFAAFLSSRVPVFISLVA
jgi:hypothetical protein